MSSTNCFIHPASQLHGTRTGDGGSPSQAVQGFDSLRLRAVYATGCTGTGGFFSTRRFTVSESWAPFFSHCSTRSCFSMTFGGEVSGL